MHGEAKHLALIRAQTGVAGVKLASEHNIRTASVCVQYTAVRQPHRRARGTSGCGAGCAVQGGAGRRDSRKVRSSR